MLPSLPRCRIHAWPCPRACPPDPSLVDHVVILHGVSWAEYEAVLAMRGERSVPRIAVAIRLSRGPEPRR